MPILPFNPLLRVFRSVLDSIVSWPDHIQNSANQSADPTECDTKEWAADYSSEQCNKPRSSTIASTRRSRRPRPHPCKHTNNIQQRYGNTENRAENRGTAQMPPPPMRSLDGVVFGRFVRVRKVSQFIAAMGFAHVTAATMSSPRVIC